MPASKEEVFTLQWEAALEARDTERARRAPHVLMRPALYPDGDSWCALYGKDLVTGVAGFGDTPAEAMSDFDNKWISERAFVHSPTGAAEDREDDH